jgi:hypothetical protein
VVRPASANERLNTYADLRLSRVRSTVRQVPSTRCWSRTAVPGLVGLTRPVSRSVAPVGTVRDGVSVTFAAELFRSAEVAGVAGSSVAPRIMAATVVAARRTERFMLRDSPVVVVRGPYPCAGGTGRRGSYSVPRMADSSFDIVSKVDRQEVDNALNQTAKEISQRFDFKNVGASIKWSGEAVRMEANSEERVKAILDVFETKLVKRGISLKALKKGEPQLSGKEYYLICEIEEGISTENAKKVSKMIRDEGPKSVKAQIQGDELRVSSKSRDDLQAVQALLKGKDLDFAVQFTNYR